MGMIEHIEQIKRIYKDNIDENGVKLYDKHLLIYIYLKELGYNEEMQKIGLYYDVYDNILENIFKDKKTLLECIQIREIDKYSNIEEKIKKSNNLNKQLNIILSIAIYLEIKRYKEFTILTNKISNTIKENLLPRIEKEEVKKLFMKYKKFNKKDLFNIEEIERICLYDEENKKYIKNIQIIPESRIVYLICKYDSWYIEIGYETIIIHHKNRIKNVGYHIQEKLRDNVSIKRAIDIIINHEKYMINPVMSKLDELFIQSEEIYKPIKK